MTDDRRVRHLRVVRHLPIRNFTHTPKQRTQPMNAASNSDARKRATAPVDPVEVVARAVTTAIGEDFDDNEVIDQAFAMDCGRDVVAALRAEGLLA